MSGLNRPKGMSLLDYLWVTYGLYDVVTDIINTDTPDSIATSDAVKDYINSKIQDNIKGSGITNIKVITDPSEATDDSTLYIIVAENTFAIQFGEIQFKCNCTCNDRILSWNNWSYITYNDNKNILWQE